MPFLLQGRGIISKTNFTFPARARLKTRRDFLQVRECGKRVYSRHLLVVYAPNEKNSRLGIAVTKKTEALAVNRNRVKRVIREIFRLHYHRILGNFDFVVIVRKNVKELSYQGLLREFLDILMKEGLLKKKRDT
ncbi:MAG: ribonuclease P protein component [SAR324 cluster bacterium]|uniref:Ribonuclease P protein component n=1 Tax=SAR324 cluster bacterium TaxID=2024889 RepID=A0A7X9IKQ3_9DELT|nr:ribonuclease P protein component [SAR324 cluster bacterium]